jgi:hypothetical protein
VEAALNLTEQDLRRMERVLHAQRRRKEESRDLRQAG